MNPLDKFNSNNKKHNCSLCGRKITRHAKVSIRATSPSNVPGKIQFNSYRFILCDEHFNQFKEVMGKFIQDNAKKVTKSSSSNVSAKVHTDTDGIDEEFEKEIDELLNN